MAHYNDSFNKTWTGKGNEPNQFSEGVKQGDRVIVQGDSYNDVPYTAEVTKVDKSKITVQTKSGAVAFGRTNGKEWGKSEHRFADTIYPLTERNTAEMVGEQHRIETEKQENAIRREVIKLWEEKIFIKRGEWLDFPEMSRIRGHLEAILQEREAEAAIKAAEQEHGA